tara:strand:+ start:87 stop:821 length:735 start_codon:yes stop_codon:yes gene_type:complete
MKEIALIIDTHSSYADAWSACFGRLNKHFPKEIKKYVFTDSVEYDFDEGYQVENYDNADSYRNQFLNCLRKVEEPYMLYSSEDYILYDDVSLEKIKSLVEVLRKDPDYSFIKLIRGPETLLGKYNLQQYDDLFVINSADSNFFAQQASIWKTSDFIKVFEASPPENGRMQQEPGGSAICRSLGLAGLQCYNGEALRGLCHHDSTVYPYIATAITKGKWNVSEYLNELNDVFQEYQINPLNRGVR